jgi:four helix bundle protein
MISKEIAERAFRFACRIVKLYERLIKKGGAARELAPQLLHCGTSIGANLEEATAGQTKPDFIAKVCIARKEARETVHWLQLLVTTNLVARDEIAWELSEAEQFVPILGAIVFNSRQSTDRGQWT